MIDYDLQRRSDSASVEDRLTGWKRPSDVLKQSTKLAKTSFKQLLRVTG